MQDTMKIKIGLVLLFYLFMNVSAFAQSPRVKVPSYFGLQVRPILPTRFIGNPELKLQTDANDPLFVTTTLRQRLGYSFGATVRAGITKLIAFETGINFNQRNFDVEMELPDSALYAKTDLSFINYDIPINALFYIRLAERWYMNASLGLALTFSPTNIRVDSNPRSVHYFSQTGLVDSKVGLDLNANIGFEFRTEKSGFFYLGGSGRVPFKPIFTLLSEHYYQAFATKIYGDVDGTFLSIDFKYFFPNIENKGEQFKHAPIVQ